MSLRETRERIVREHMEAENRLDYDTAIATFSHPHYELVGTGAVFDGEEAVRDYFKQSRTPFPDQNNEVIALHQADDAVIAEFWLMGTHKGPLRTPQGEIAPTGKSFRVRMAAVFEFEGEKIVCERVYFDQASILKQITA